MSNIIKFYPLNEDVPAFVPEPMPASKALPQWYKDTPGSIDSGEMMAQIGQPASTVKKCMPVFDAITAGYIFRLPMDVYVDATGEKLTYQIPLAMGKFKGDMFATHERRQYEKYPYGDKWHQDLLRIMPFWIVKTPKGFSTLVTQPMHGDSSPLYAVSGLVDTDGFATDGHFSFWVEKGFKGTIPQGTPIAQLIPIRRDDWQMELQTYEDTKKDILPQRFNLRSTFSNGYKNKFRSRKEYK
jgi:hypothetical protein